ncbi:MAG: hypothetical protein KDK99_22260 [Verrucomicrobiales bacterium]|nr:hypothetical protein [Verrucomicrobiales bacterium]
MPRLECCGGAQFIITAAAEKLAALSTVDYLGERAKRADFKEFERISALISAGPADPGDEFP